jgi:hypothetical protein
MSRRKMDLLDFGMSESYWLGSEWCMLGRTAYAMRPPFASEDRGVGCPRVVLGDGAQMASVVRN